MRKPYKIPPLRPGGAVPLYLSAAHSLHAKCPETFPLPMSCYQAVDAIRAEEAKGNGTKVVFNPGFGRFDWPPPRMVSSKEVN